MGTSAALDGPTILANATALGPLVRREIDEAERRHQLTPSIVEALRASGVFRMPMPTAWGGPEVDILSQVRIIEEVSRAYGSAGWCAMIGSDGGFLSASLDDQTGRGLYRDHDLDAVTAGAIAPVGRLEVVDGGFVLSGKWSFGSGCTHADVIFIGAIVFEDGHPVVNSDLTPEGRIALLPAVEVTILADTWQTTGLAGSGSNDFTIDGVFVPRERTFRFGEVKRSGALYAWPGLFVANITGVPLGVAQDALDTATEVLSNKLILPEKRLARDEPRVRTAMARAQAIIGSARSYVFDILGDFWATLLAGDGPTLRQRAALGGCYVHTFRTCLEAVQLLYETAGSTAIYRACPLDRHLRDLTTMGQHVLAQTRILETTGAMWFDIDSGHPLL